MSRKQLFVLGGVVALFNCLLFADVFALLRFSVPVRTRLVIGVSLGVYPNLAGARRAAGDRGWRGRRFFAEDTAKRALRGWARNRRGICDRNR